MVDSLEFDIKQGKTPDIFHVSGDIYAIAYAGDGDDGFLKTIEITMAGDGTSTYEIVSTASSSTITALVSIAGENVSILSWQIE